MPVISIVKIENGGDNESKYTFLVPTYAKPEKAQATFNVIQERFTSLIMEQDSNITSSELAEAINKGHYRNSNITLAIIISK